MFRYKIISLSKEVFYSGLYGPFISRVEQMAYNSLNDFGKWKWPKVLNLIEEMILSMPVKES